jgi:hypothetical protein
MLDDFPVTFYTPILSFFFAFSVATLFPETTKKKKHCYLPISLFFFFPFAMFFDFSQWVFCNKSTRQIVLSNFVLTYLRRQSKAETKLHFTLRAQMAQQNKQKKARHFTFLEIFFPPQPTGSFYFISSPCLSLVFKKKSTFSPPHRESLTSSENV